jgi:solute carrier family 25 carnitine/acylcarnitine transporter 20/29
MPEDDAAQKPKTSAAWAGLASGISQVLAEHPLDTIKIRLQSRALAFDVLEGPRAVAAKALSEEGVSALFRGLVPRLLTYAPVKSMLFAQYDYYGGTPWAGALAGGCNTLLSCPVDALKSRVQTRRDTLKWTEVMRQMYREGGLTAFYRGWLPLFCRDVPGYFLLFGIYEHGRELPQPLVGAAAGVAFYGSTLPIDRVKTIMMTQSIVNPRFASPVDCARDIYLHQGLRGFYRASLPTLLRTACGQAVALTVYGILR